LKEFVEINGAASLDGGVLELVELRLQTMMSGCKNGGRNRRSMRRNDCWDVDWEMRVRKGDDGGGGGGRRRRGGGGGGGGSWEMRVRNLSRVDADCSQDLQIDQE
jgi:hypothetical protein